MKNQNQTPKGPKFGSLGGSSVPELDRMRGRAAFRRALIEGGRAELDAARRAANSPSNLSFIEQNDRAHKPTPARLGDSVDDISGARA